MTDPDPDVGDHAWGWTAAPRAKQAQAIQYWKPWVQSKGPVTAQGKARVTRNASKPNSVRRQVASLMAELRQLKATEEEARRRR